MMTKALPLKQRTPLTAIKAAKVESAWRILLYGIPGIGKTTFAAGLPDPVFLCLSDGDADEHDVARWPDPVETFDDLRDMIRRLTDEDHSFKSLVIDLLDMVEPLVWGEVVRRDGKALSIEDVGGGYAKGYNAAIDVWRVLTADLERMQAKRGINLLITAHAVRREHRDPERPNYDRWEPNIHKKAAGYMVGWFKTVLFAQTEIGTVKMDGAKGKDKAIVTGARVIRTVWNPAYDAKNRHNLPDPMPLDYAEFAEAMTAKRVAPLEEIRGAIADKLTQLADEALTSKVQPLVIAAADDAAALANIDNRLLATLAQRQKGQ
jgi:hypothetical protein